MTQVNHQDNQSCNPHDNLIQDRVVNRVRSHRDNHRSNQLHVLRCAPYLIRLANQRINRVQGPLDGRLTGRVDSPVLNPRCVHQRNPWVVLRIALPIDPPRNPRIGHRHIQRINQLPSRVDNLPVVLLGNQANNRHDNQVNNRHHNRPGNPQYSLPINR